MVSKNFFFFGEKLTLLFSKDFQQIEGMHGISWARVTAVTHTEWQHEYREKKTQNNKKWERAVRLYKVLIIPYILY